MRIYLEQAQRVSKAPKGGVTIYPAGHYNVDSALAETWIKSGAAFPVDASDEPIRDPKLRVGVFNWSSSKDEED